jgi:hypothetical protein
VYPKDRAATSWRYALHAFSAHPQRSRNPLQRHQRDARSVAELTRAWRRRHCRDIRAIRQNAGMTHFRPRRLVGFKMKIHLSLEAKHESCNARKNIKPQRSKSALSAKLFGSIEKVNHPPRLTLGTKGTFLGCFD